jgi:hypothetical protein
VNEAYETGFECWQIPDQTCVGRWITGGVGKTNRFTRDLCGAPAVTVIAGAAFCKRHEEWALEWCSQSEADRERGRELAEARAARAYEEAQREARQEAERKVIATSWAASGSHVIYYAQRLSDGLIKIGTSARLQRRLWNLGREHGELRLLLTHLGDRERETQMHGKFKRLWVEGEWFRPEEPLLSWIVTVRRKHANTRTVLPGTVPLPAVLALLGEAADPAA